MVIAFQLSLPILNVVHTALNTNDHAQLLQGILSSANTQSHVLLETIRAQSSHRLWQQCLTQLTLLDDTNAIEDQGDISPRLKG